MTCLARRHNDQMMCHHCGLVWDVNDPEPPTCLENRLNRTGQNESLEIHRVSATDLPVPPPPRDVKGGAKSFFDYAKQLLEKTK